MEKVYKLTLTTKSNLHVGSGETIDKFQYFKPENGDKIFIYDFEKLIKLIISKGKEKELENMILNVSDSNYKKNQVDYKKLVEGNLQELKNCYKTEIKCYGGLKNPKPIEQITRNELGVYIPGSSIKGFIKRIIEGDDQKIDERFTVSDSLPIPDDKLFISGIARFNPKKDKKIEIAGNGNFVEFIKPDTKITFIVKISEKLLERFKDNLTLINKNYNSFYLSKFQHNSIKMLRILDDTNVFRIGGYTNFLIKTTYIDRNNTENDLYDDLKRNIQYLRFFQRKSNTNKAKENFESGLNTLFPTTIKLSANSDGWFAENGICHYDFTEIKDEINSKV